MFSKYEKALMIAGYAIILSLGFIAGTMACFFDSTGIVRGLFVYDANVVPTRAAAIEEVADNENVANENEGVEAESGAMRSRSAVEEGEPEASATQEENPVSEEPQLAGVEEQPVEAASVNAVEENDYTGSIVVTDSSSADSTTD